MDEDEGTSLSIEEQEKCKTAFDIFDSEGFGTIDCIQIKNVFEQIGQILTEEEVLKMVDEADTDNTGVLNFDQFLNLYEQDKKKRNRDNEADTLDAFVAMGGNEDKSGSVDAETLINVIKNEFGMTIDIEKLIEDIDTDKSGKIEYEEFKTLLSSN